MTLDEFKSAKREWVDYVNYDFPEERMGTGDKLILRRVVEERAKHFRENFPDTSIRSTIFLLDVRLEMERYGYRTKPIRG